MSWQNLVLYTSATAQHSDEKKKEGENGYLDAFDACDDRNIDTSDTEVIYV